MRKRIIRKNGSTDDDRGDWLDLAQLATVEITSEDAQRPIEAALLPGREGGWRAAEPGPQTLRLIFDQPQRLRRVRLQFSEPAAHRTHQFVLRWSEGQDQPFHEIVRQQWNFSPPSATQQAEDYQVELAGVAILELIIVPDISGSDAVASLDYLQVA